VIDGGTRVDEAARFGAAFGKAGVDWLSVSKGGKFEDAKQPRLGEAAYPYTGESGEECMPTVYSDERGPFSRNVRSRPPCARRCVPRASRRPSSRRGHRVVRAGRGNPGAR